MGIRSLLANGIVSMFRLLLSSWSFHAIVCKQNKEALTYEDAWPPRDLISDSVGEESRSLVKV